MLLAVQTPNSKGGRRLESLMRGRVRGLDKRWLNVFAKQAQKGYPPGVQEVYPIAKEDTRTGLLARIMEASTIGRMILSGEAKQTNVISVEESVRAKREPIREELPRTMRMNPILCEDF